MTGPENYWWDAARGVGACSVPHRGRTVHAYMGGGHALIDGERVEYADDLPWTRVHAEAVECGDGGMASVSLGNPDHHLPGLHRVHVGTGIAGDETGYFCRGRLVYAEWCPEFPAEVDEVARTHRLPLITALSEAEAAVLPPWVVESEEKDEKRARLARLRFPGGITATTITLPDRRGITLARVGDGPVVTTEAPYMHASMRPTDSAMPPYGTLVHAAYAAYLGGLSSAVSEYVTAALRAHQGSRLVSEFIREMEA